MSRVLIVDDEKSIRNTFSAFLTNEGHTVDTAENVEKALEIMKQESPDLVITDIIMPRFTGMELLKRIKEHDIDIPVIVMTGEPTVETAQESVTNSAFDYLTKPINKSKLVQSVKKALEHKKLLDIKKQLEAENKEYRDHLESLVSMRTKALNDTIYATISTIASLVELRDPYTAGHQRKVGNLSAAIGKKIGLPKEQLDCLHVAGYLHDIGKIAVPSEILSKPGSLSDVEFEMIKAHVKYGYDILKKVTLPWPIDDVVYQHHERMDGSGYPNGIKGSDIRIEARIIAVADVIEAMTSHRPYRASLGIDQAIEEVESNKGELYDKDIVSAAIALLQKDNYQLSDEMDLCLNLADDVS